PDEGPGPGRDLTLLLVLDPRLDGDLAPPGRPADLVLAGRIDGLLLGLTGAGRAAAPRHLVHQLDLPRHRRAALRLARQVRQRLVAGDPLDGRVLAQPPPRRPDLCAPRRPARPGRHLRPH